MPDAVSLSPTPAALGYSMPAEWSRHRATWLSWPHSLDTWPTQIETVRDLWLEMICALSPHEKVCLLVNDEAAEQQVLARLRRAKVELSNVTLLKIPTVDVWMRDYGPTFVTRAAAADPLAFNDWVFNGWGGKYEDYKADDAVARKISALLNVPVFEHALILEGGSIEVNGAGTCLTTEQCLLNRNRNPQFSRSEIEQFLRDSLGLSQVIWLGEGVVGDDTDGHIDDIARFVDPMSVVCILEANPRDANYHALQENYQRLQDARTPSGSKFNIITLPCPEPIYSGDARLPASYVNFYIANEVVLVPVFDDLHDGEALGILQEHFPDRAVIGLRCNAVVAGLGAIHCVTQQEPAALPSS
jgi:agmatine deiminase